MPGPTVVLVHGLAGSATTTWRDAAWFDLLADAGREVVGIDLPGHGSNPLGADEPVPLYHEWLLDQLPPEPVDAVGFSLGAKTLLLAASSAPERFHRLVVAGVGNNLFVRLEALSDLAELVEAGDDSSPMARYFLEHARRSGQPPATLANIIRSDQGTVTPEGLANVKVPVLVALGDADFAGPADPLVDALPDATFVGLRNVDHFSTPKDFGFLDAALDFLGAAP